MEKPVTEARREFADLVNRVAYTGERVALTRRGKVMAALVSAEDLELLERMREMYPGLAGTVGQVAPPPAEEPAAPRPQQPMRIAAEYRPPGPPRPPGFGR